MYHHVFPGFSHAAVHPLQAGVDELPPEIVSHDQTDLLPPVVPEVDRVDVVFEGLVNLPQVVVADRVQQFVHESRVDVEVHQQVLDPAQGPGPFVERESDLEDAEHVGLLPDFALDIGEKARVERVGKTVSFEGRFGKHAPFHIPDVLVHAAVPDYAENIADQIVPQILEESDVASELQDVVAQNGVEIVRCVVVHELLLGLFGEFEGPRHIGGLLAVKYALDNFAFGHFVFFNV